MNATVTRRPSWVGRRGAQVAVMAFAASVPLEELGRLGPLGSLARATGIVAGLGVLVAALVDLPVRRLERTFFLMAGLVAWTSLSYFWSSSPDGTTTRIATSVQLLGLAWILWQQLRTREACTGVMLGYVAGAAIGCVSSIALRQPHGNGIDRFAVGDPNDFGVIVVIAIVMAVHLMQDTSSPVLRAAFAAFVALAVVAVFLTASRTALVTLAVAALVALANRRLLSPVRLVGVTVVVVIAFSAVVRLASQEQLGRITSIGAAVDSGFNQRTTYWQLGWDTFSRHPIAGVGANAFRTEAAEVTGISRVAHNSFLGVAADLGIIGLGLFTATLASGWANLLGLPRRLRQTWAAVGVAWLLGASTLTWEHRKLTWFLVFLLAAQADAERRARHAALEPARSASPGGA